jgi:parvulin-like peptidyl-prolyl isomerase
MKYHCVLSLGACVLGLGVSLRLSATEPATKDAASPDIPPALIEEIVAKVNGDIVTKGEVERQRRQIQNEVRAEAARNPGRLKDLSAVATEREKDVLRDRIDTLLLVQKGKELNISVDSEVSKYLANLQAESKIADPEKFQEYVHEQTGMTYEDFKNDVKNNMLTQRVVRQEVGGRINVKHEDQQKYYDEHKAEFVREERVFLREIFISADSSDAAAKAAAEKKAKGLVARARKGDKFPDLARDNSDSQTAKQGGDMGGFKKGDLRQDIEQQVWDKEKGYVSDPIDIGNGYLIVKVEDHQKAGQATLEEVENEIMDKLFMPKMEPAIREYLTKLRQEAYLQVKPGWVDTGAAAGMNTGWVDPAQLKAETVTKQEVLSKVRKKRLLWMVPVPGTSTAVTGKSSSR